jgi:hypothetical protein
LETLLTGRRVKRATTSNNHTFLFQLILCFILGGSSLQNIIGKYETVETQIQSVIEKIQAIFDTYPNLSDDYPTVFKTITEYKTAFTNSLATYKTEREGYQADYNGIIYLEEQLRELKDLQDLNVALECVSSSFQAIIDQDTQKHSTNECTDLIESVEKFVNDIFNHETDVFNCLKIEADQNITCDIDGKENLKEQLDKFNIAILETNNNVTEKEKELAFIKRQLVTYKSKENERNIQTKTSKVNCTQVLNFTKPTFDDIFYESTDISYNSNKTENVTVVFVRGDTVRKVLNFGTNSPRIIEVKCLSPNGM